jgi:hypothetical protein
MTVAACADANGPLQPGLSAATSSNASSPGNVYAMTNDGLSNAVVVLDRGADGTLTLAGSFPTGGRGSGTFENSANGLILGEQSPNNLNGSHKYLYATNAGSNSITVFRTTHDGLEITDVEPSGGDHPISVTVHDNTLYVLNGGASNCTGGTPSIVGFRVSPRGELTQIPGSMRPVSGGANSGCAQISFTPSGDVLVVTQRRQELGPHEWTDRQRDDGNGPLRVHVHPAWTAPHDRELRRCPASGWCGFV